MLYYLIASILTGASAFAARNERQIHLAGVAFYAVQAAFALWITLGGGYDTSSLGAFRFDAAGTLFFVLLTVVSIYAFAHSEAYLRGSDLGQMRSYFALVISSYKISRSSSNLEIRRSLGCSNSSVFSCAHVV